MNYNCQYCDLRCKKDQVYDVWACPKCHTTYLETGTISFTWYQPDDAYYLLQLAPARNKTYLFYNVPNQMNMSQEAYDELPKKSRTILTLEFILPGVNPTNYKDKIRTLITFS